MSWATPERILVEHGPSDLLFKSSIEFCGSLVTLASHDFQEQSQRFICPSFTRYMFKIPSGPHSYQQNFEWFPFQMFQGLATSVMGQVSGPPTGIPADVFKCLTILHCAHVM